VEMVGSRPASPAKLETMIGVRRRGYDDPLSRPDPAERTVAQVNQPQFLPGKGLAGAETGPGFLAATPYSARQRLAYLASMGSPLSLTAASQRRCGLIATACTTSEPVRRAPCG
jgi:hypothetical protein